jgi:hypothetical protein
MERAMDWTRPEFFSAIALLISAGGVGLSIFSLRRTYAAEKPIAWLVIEPSGIPDCWITNLPAQSIEGHPASAFAQRAYQDSAYQQKTGFLSGRLRGGMVHYRKWKARAFVGPRG